MDYETPQFFRLMEYARAADRDVVDLVSGSPDWEPPAAFREGLREYADMEESAFNYGPSEGLLELREQIAAHHGVAVERVIVTNGTGEANHLAMTTALERDAGSTVVLTDPVYPYYAGRANLLDADARFVRVDDENRLDPATLREAVTPETAAIVVNTPNNPTGAVYGTTAMAEFAAIAEQHDAVLVSDEVYERFDYAGRFASALDTGSPNVVVTGAFSKSMAITGARVGYGIFPADAGPEGAPKVDGATIAERARTRHMLTNVTGSRPVQYAVSRALDETPESYYATNRDRMAERIDAFCAVLDRIGAEYRRPEGAFYVLASLPGIGGSLSDAFDLIDEAGVAAMPGAAFGEARPDHLRFALLTPRFETAAARLAEYVDSQ